MRWLLLGFALAGLAFASASAWVHYRILTDPTYISPCDLNATFNCSQVYLSRFGSIAGVPVALGGVIWFGLVALVVAFGGPDRRAPRTAGAAQVHGAVDPTGSYVFALATVGLATILYLGYASFFILKHACLLCMGTYVCVIGIFLVSGFTTSITMMRVPALLFRDLRAIVSRPATLLVAVLFLAGAASVVAFFPKESRLQQAPAAPVSADVQDGFAKAWAAQPRLDLGIPPSAAKVVIVKFNDWLCPGCKQYQEAYKPILDKYEKSNPGAVVVILKDWPWSNTCNFNIQSTIHGHEASCEAAAAMRLARDHGKADEMMKWIYDNQQQLVEMDLKGGTEAQEAIKAHVSSIAGVSDFDRQYPAKLIDIRRDIADGGVLQVRTTPTFFVNGVRTTDANTMANLPPEYLDLAIQIELKKAAGK